MSNGAMGGIVGAALIAANAFKIRVWIYYNLMSVIFVVYILLAVLAAYLLIRLKKKEAATLKRIKSLEPLKAKDIDSFYGRKS